MLPFNMSGGFFFALAGLKEIELAELKLASGLCIVKGQVCRAISRKARRRSMGWLPTCGAYPFFFVRFTSWFVNAPCRSEQCARSSGSDVLTHARTSFTSRRPAAQAQTLASPEPPWIAATMAPPRPTQHGGRTCHVMRPLLFPSPASVTHCD